MSEQQEKTFTKSSIPSLFFEVVHFTLFFWCKRVCTVWAFREISKIWFAGKSVQLGVKFAAKSALNLTLALIFSY